jgi:hypothetical protein
MSKILTPAMLWKNYDKPERDLNITVIHSSEKTVKSILNYILTEDLLKML